MQSAVRVLVAMLVAGTMFGSPAHADNMTLSLSSSDFVVTPSYGDVDFFTIDVEIARPLAQGLYVNPPLVDVAYQVRGTLPPGTPSGSRTLNLQRYMSGDEFYAQGGSLRFEIRQSAILIDGIQVIELVGSGTVLTFDAREINTGRYTPPQLTLDANARGQLQNSNNVPSVDPPVTVDFGEEYITGLLFDPGNTTVLVAKPDVIIDDDDGGTICIISNLVNGTFLQSELKRLREFRDKYLLPYKFGQQFVAWYYRVSPALTGSVAQHATLRVLALAALTPVIYGSKYPVAVILLMGAMVWLMFLLRNRHVSRHPVPRHAVNTSL
jgi:hypothetical protein